MNKFDLSEKLKEELIKRNLFEQEDFVAKYEHL